MCDAATRQIVESVLQEKVGRAEMFTAFDVSLEVKRRGGAERHRDMKPVVHEFFEGGRMGADYTRTLIPIPGAPCPAWLYHRLGDSPAAYQPLPRARASRPAARRPTRVPGGGFVVDRRSRICVPVGLLRRAGLRPGDQAWVVADPRHNALALTRTGPRTGRAGLAHYRVDRYGNVRIAQRVLRKASLAGQVFEMDCDQRKVTVRLHQSAGQAGNQ